MCVVSRRNTLSHLNKIIYKKLTIYKSMRHAVLQSNLKPILAINLRTCLIIIL